MAEPLISAAIDLGATSGRVIVGSWDKETLQLDEIHRFPNRIQSLGGHDYWNLAGLFEEILTGLQKARSKYPTLSLCGVTTWGVDHVLLDQAGRLIFPPHAYRDGRTATVREKLTPEQEETLFRTTGITTLPYNTSLQLAEVFGRYPALAQVVDKILYLPDYFAWLLSGRMATDYSIASTSQLLSVETPDYAPEALRIFGLPEGKLCIPEPAGRILGPIQGQKGLEGIEVILTPGHDTANAFAAMPTEENEPTLFLSSGTWSLVGCIHPTALVTPEARAAGISNERMGDGSFRPVCNLLGLWLLEKTLPDLGGTPRDAGEWENLIAEAETVPTPSDTELIAIDDERLFNPVNMKEAIDRQRAEKGLAPLSGRARYVRLILASLAAGHARAMRSFQSMTGRPFHSILIVGGGSRNRLLCQETANRCGLPVHSYALEGTAVGSIGQQLIACGAVDSFATFRTALRRQLAATVYQPT